ncbi:hypothetical protein [Streptomyces sp. NPDC059466]|uniref:hypothetical protein n=1 Tax=unclassified Streptomyces TaxID=2593676 RepID=UPI00368E3B88
MIGRVSGKPVVRRDRQDRAPGAQGRLEDQARAGALERQTDDIRHVIGHPPTTLDRAVTVTAAPARPAGPAPG